MYKCKYCGKEFDSAHSVNYHEKVGCIFNKDSKKALKPYQAKNGDLLDSNNYFVESYKKNTTACEICGKEIKTMAEGNCLCVDHDHISKRFRGMLCIRCNLSLA